MPARDANRKASKIESPGTNGTTMPIAAPRRRSSAATGVGQQVAAHSSAGRNDAGSSSATTAGASRRTLVHDPAEDAVVVIRRQPRQVAEPLDERRLGGARRSGNGLLQHLRGGTRERCIHAALFSFCAYCASESMSRVLSCRPCLTRYLRSAKTSASSSSSTAGHFSRRIRSCRSHGGATMSMRGLSRL